MSPTKLQSQVDKVQTVCKVASGIAKAVVKSYATGSAIGFIAQIPEAKAVSDTVKSVQDLQKEAKQLEAIGSTFVNKVKAWEIAQLVQLVLSLICFSPYSWKRGTAR